LVCFDHSQSNLFHNDPLGTPTLLILMTYTLIFILKHTF